MGGVGCRGLPEAIPVQMPEQERPDRLGNGGAIDLDPTAGRTVFDIRAGIFADQAALKALQEYVKEVCR